MYVSKGELYHLWESLGAGMMMYQAAMCMEVGQLSKCVGSPFSVGVWRHEHA